jgi:hypothetical protein
MPRRPRPRAPKADAIPTEHEEQRELVSWFRKTYPGVLIFAVPNGGYRGKAAAGRIKLEGGVAGIPDLCVPAWNLWVEMKRAKSGRLSAEQKEVIAYLEQIGHTVIIGRGFEDARRQVEEAVRRTALD